MKHWKEFYYANDKINLFFKSFVTVFIYPYMYTYSYFEISFFLDIHHVLY